MAYVGGNSVRELVQPENLMYKVETGTPRFLPMPAHGEMYYSSRWPDLVAFCCVQPAKSWADNSLFRRHPARVR